jgi:hypothetical protein
MYPVSFKAINNIVSRPTKPIPLLDELKELIITFWFKINYV